MVDYAFDTATNIKYIAKTTEKENREIRNARSDIERWKEGEGIHLPGLVGGGENAVRPWAHTCYVLASCLRFDICNYKEMNLSETRVEEMTIELISELAGKHCSNYYCGWGSCWQSALWAENIAYAAWLLWDRLPESVQEDVANMMIFEADRFISYKVPYYRDLNGEVMYEGDTKGEENAWNSRILALAVCMMPEHVHADLWEDKMNELLISSAAAPDDIGSMAAIGGYTLSSILNGSNINADGTVVNHGLVHLDYSNVIVEGMLDTAIIYRLSGREVPDTAVFNHDRLYRALVEIDIGVYDADKKGHHFYERNGDGTAGMMLNMPVENDWGGQWYASCYLTDTVVEMFHLDEGCMEGLGAADWAFQHLRAVEEQVMDTYDGKAKGQYFADGESQFVSGEVYMMQNMCKAYLLRMLFA